VLREYLQQMMPNAQAARLVAHYDNTLEILARIPCAADIRSHLVDCVDFVTRDTQSVDQSRCPISAAGSPLSFAESGRSRVPGYKGVYPGVADEWKSQILTMSRPESKGPRICQIYNEASGTPRSGVGDPWASCDDFDPALSRCKSPAGYCSLPPSPIRLTHRSTGVELR